MKKVLAFDFGASSGRAILGCFDGKRIELSEIHRFRNDPVMLGDHYRWDVMRLFFEIKEGIRRCAAAGHADISSIGIDTWGVDFVLLDRNGDLLANPFHYRDFSPENMEKTVQRIGKEKIYSKTGIQFLPFNTIYQLAYIREHAPFLLDNAKRFLMIPDYFGYLLTGECANEFTDASTTQLLNASTGGWDEELLRAVGADPALFSRPAAPGTVLGTLRREIAEECGVGRVPVVLSASHDTASAVAAVPFEDGESGVYVSCGTWSLMGTVLDSPKTAPECMKANFTNEGGIFGTARFLKNIMGLWLIQESRRQWIREGREMSFDELEAAANASPSGVSFIDPDDAVFSPPGDIPGRIAEYCRRAGQPVPSTPGETARCIYESLAYKYRYTADTLEKLLGRRFDTVRMVGGGIKDGLLCRTTALLTGRRVLAGPVEATAMGNVAVQLASGGDIAGPRQIGAVVRASARIDVYESGAGAGEGYERFRSVCGLD